MIDLYFYFLKQNGIVLQVTVDGTETTTQYIIDCVKLGGDGFKSNSYARINSKFLEDGLKQVLETFDMLEAFNDRYVKVMEKKSKENLRNSVNTIQMTESSAENFAYLG